MNKAKKIKQLILYNVIILTVASSISLATTGGTIYGFEDIEPGLNLEYVLAFLKMIGGFFGFGVTNFPPLASFALLWLPNITFILYIIGVIRGTD